MQAKHEGRGSEATLGWPYAGRALDRRPLWPMSAQPRATDAHEPIFKVHRHPISAVASIANGHDVGRVPQPVERRWDARVALRQHLVPPPLGGARLAKCCATPRRHARRAARAAAARAALL